MFNTGDYVIPVFICGILLFGVVKKIDVFDEFVTGAKDGIKVSFNILPPLIALLLSVGMFRASGGLNFITQLLSPISNALNVPKEIIPLAILRPISGSGSLAMFEDIMKNYGPDSYIGRIASVLQGSTETTFYTIAVYYGAIKISKTRYTLPSALVGDFLGFVMSAVIVRLMFY